VEHSGEIKSGAGRVALVGESAGANLAVSVAMAARDGNLSAPSYQVLVYPVVDSDTETTSYRINAHAKPLNRAMLKWFFAHETASADAHDSRLVPLHANLSNLPPSTVITAQIDPLPSEGDAFAQRLSEHGVPVRYRHYNGVTHEFFWHGGGFARGERGAGGCGRRFAVGAGRRNDGNLIGGEGNYFDVREAR
jgi:acetyl esterase